jgi:hypothetical protein
MSDRWRFGLLLLALVSLMAVYHLRPVPSGHFNFRDQHLGAALEYAKGKIDLLRPVIVGFNATNEPTPLEIPIWQAAAAIFFKTFGTWFGWANIVSLLFFVWGLWPLFQLARRYGDERGAWWTLIFYSAQPVVFYMAGRGGTDGSCEAFAIWFLFCADRLVRTGRWIWWGPSALFAVLSATTKLPFFFCVGLAGFFLLLLHGRRSWVRWLQLGSVGLCALVVMAIWTRYSNGCFGRAEMPFVDLTSSNQEMKGWYFGDWSYRLNPANWIKGGWRVLNTVLGSFALAALPLWALCYSRQRIAQFWVAGAVLTTLVFTHLVLHHDHYYLMFTPAVALLCAQAARGLEEVTGFNHWKRQGLVLGAAGAVLVASTIQGLIGMNLVLDVDPARQQCANIIQQYTRSADKLLIQGGGWGGTLLILSDRKGLSIWDTRFLDDTAALERIKALGFTKLVMISESKLHHAVVTTKPGRHQLERDTYDRYLIGVARAWPVLFQNEEILIKDIPR